MSLPPSSSSSSSFSSFSFSPPSNASSSSSLSACSSLSDPLYGVAPAPLWLIVLSILLMSLSTALANHAARWVMQEVADNSEWVQLKNWAKETPEEDLSVELENVSSFWRDVLHFSPSLSVALCLAYVINYIIIIVHTASNQNNLSTGWHSFLYFAISVANSGMPVGFINFLISYMYNDTALNLSFVAILACLLSPLLLLVLPIWIVYIWLFAPIVLALTCILPFFENHFRKHSKWSSGLFGFLLRVLWSFAFVFSVQIGANYATLVYSGAWSSSDASSYTSVIATEFRIRSTDCYFQTVGDDVKTAMGFVTMLL